MLKKMNPNTGKKKNRPKIKFSLAYRFFFFKKRSPNQLPATFSLFWGIVTCYFRQVLFVIRSGGWHLFYLKKTLIKYITYLYYKNDHSSTEMGYPALCKISLFSRRNIPEIYKISIHQINSEALFYASRCPESQTKFGESRK